MKTYHISVLNIKNELVNNGHFVVKPSSYSPVSKESIFKVNHHGNEKVHQRSVN